MKRELTNGQEVRVGVISDTHGPLKSWVLDAFGNVDAIVHAGDICHSTVIGQLSQIAPVSFVHGNMDPYEVTRRSAMREFGGAVFYILHDLFSLDLDPVAAGISVVVHGHTHRAATEWRNGVLYFNPGSAARPRGGARESVGIVQVAVDDILPQIMYRQ